MTSSAVINEMALENVHAIAESKKVAGYRYVQTLCVNTEDGIDLMHSFMKDDVMENYVVRGLQKTDVVPSITDLYFSAFVFENEVHDLFGVNIENIAIDFGGNFYAVSQKEPMTIISPAKKAAQEKAKKLAAAKAAKAAKDAGGAADAGAADED
ncbi:MAG: NADH-quinone oxidoreductase subunit C, partial [Coriobacteriia bacterium]|nr:NADH-quinone oxidoreductase subunit C [Coriobacteriia bacterium]